MSLILFKVEGREVMQTDEVELGKDKIYIIIDKHAKRPKIWIWSGHESDIIDRYFAGVSATKIKSKEKLYGASIEVVESGNEPEQFPLLSKDKIIEPVGEAEILVFEEEELAPPIKEDLSVIEEKTDIIKEKIKIKTEKLAEKGDLIFKNKVKSFLRDINLEFEKLQEKIDLFLSDL